MWQGKTCTSGKTNFMHNLVIQKDDSRQSSPCVRRLSLRNTAEPSKGMLSSAISLCSVLSRNNLSHFFLGVMARVGSINSADCD